MRWVKVIIREVDMPTLVGNTTLDVELSVYHERIKGLKSMSINPTADRRRPSNIIGVFGQLLVTDLLTEHGWKIMTYELGRRTHPLHLGKPVEFLENTTGRRLGEELEKFLSSPCVGIPGMGLRADILMAKKDVFALGEIKSSQKDMKVFNLTLPQYIYYNRANELGVPIKLFLVNILDNVYIYISRYVGRLIDNGLFKIHIVQCGSKPSILRPISKKPWCKSNRNRQHDFSHALGSSGVSPNGVRIGWIGLQRKRWMSHHS